MLKVIAAAGMPVPEKKEKGAPERTRPVFLCGLLLPVVDVFDVAVVIGPGDLGVGEGDAFHVVIGLVFGQEGQRGFLLHAYHDGFFQLDGEVLFFGAVGGNAVVVNGDGALFAGAAGLVQLGAGLIQMLGNGQGVMDALAGGQTGMRVLGNFHKMLDRVDQHLVLLVAALRAIALDFALGLAFHLHISRQCHDSIPRVLRVIRGMFVYVPLPPWSVSN